MRCYLNMKDNHNFLHDKTTINLRINHLNPASILNLSFASDGGLKEFWKRREIWDFDFLIGVGVFDLGKDLKLFVINV